MSAFDEIRKQRKYKSVDMSAARNNAKQRALEQREIVVDNIQKKHFLNLSPGSKAFSQIYGSRPDPVQVAPLVLSSAVEFVKPVPSINMTNGTTAPAGTPGIASIAAFNAAIPGDYFNVPAGKRQGNTEFVIAEFPLGVGTDIAFVKPRFPQGEVELATTLSGYLRFRDEIGGPSNVNNSGYMNNGTIRFKVIDLTKQTTSVILECSCEQFNAASEGAQPEAPAGFANPTIPFNAKTTLYPNFAHNQLTTSGSTLQVTVSGIFEGPFKSDDGTRSYNPNAGLADFCPLDGDNSRFYIDTKRIDNLSNSQL